MTINTNQALGKIQSQWTQWIKNEVEFKAIDNHDIQVLTTFTDYFGDGILFNIIENQNNNFTLTDKGYTLWNMEMNGIDLTKKNTTRYKLLIWYLKSFDFTLLNGRIIKENVKLNNLSQSIIDFIQLLLRISDLGATNRANTKGIFFDDAKNYFNNDKNIFYFTTNNIAVGKTKQQYTFEYNFTPKLGMNRLTKLYNTLSKNSMEAIIGIYSDTIDYLNDNYRNSSFNILVNGISKESQPYADGLEEDDIKVIDFQNKEAVTEFFGKAA